MTTPNSGSSPLVFPVGTNVVGPVSMRTAEPGSVTFINLDSTQTIYLATTNTTAVGAPNAIPLSPGDSVTLTTLLPWYAVATAAMALLIMPGGASFAPGTVAITGPVTATISGPVTVNGGVAVTNTPAVTVANTPNVNIGNTGTVAIGNTPSVNVANTPNVNVGTVAGSIAIASVAGNVDVVGNGGVFSPGNNAVLYGPTGATITPGNAQLTGIIDGLNYQAYNLSLGAFCGAQANAGAPLTALVQIVWYADAGGTQELFIDSWWTWLGSSSINSKLVTGSGPMHGRYFQVFVFNAGTAQNITVNQLTVYGTQRTLSKPVWRQGIPTMSSASGFTQLGALGNFSADGTDDVLATISNLSLAVTTKYFVPLPLSAGPVYARFETSQSLAGDAALCSADQLLFGQIGGTSGSDPHVLVNFASVAGTDYPVNIIAGHAPLFLTVSTGASAPTINLCAASQDAG